jgi:type II secretory pathway predicted ATPase ExeA
VDGGVGGDATVLILARGLWGCGERVGQVVGVVVAEKTEVVRAAVDTLNTQRQLKRQGTIRGEQRGKCDW